MAALYWPALMLGLIAAFLAVGLTLFKTVLRVYIAGENIDESGPKIEQLLRRGFNVTSDILGEFINTPRGIIEAMKEYEDHMTVLWLWQMMFPQRNVSLAVKPSRLGLEIDAEIFKANLEKIIRLAQRNGIFVWVDAEKKKDRQTVLEAVMLMRSRGYENIGLALQCVHSDAQTILVRLLKSGTPFRLVKGAYNDGDLKSREQINQNFKNIFWSALYYYCNIELMEEIRYPRIAIATHDTDLIAYVMALERGANLSRLIQFQMLYGVRMKLQMQMAQAKKNILVYVPWGKDARGYFLRRCREGIKPSVLILFLRNIGEAIRCQKEIF